MNKPKTTGKKALITDGVHQLLLDGLEQDGYTVVYEPNISLAQVHEHIGEYEGIIINSKIIAHQELLQKAKRLKWLARLGSGMEIVDIPFAQSMGITVINTPDGNAISVAEHAIGMMLSQRNNLVRSHQQVEKLQWNREQNRGFEIFGKTIGIIGFGHTGRAVAERLAGWQVNILAYDKYKKDYAKDFYYVKETSLEDVQQNSDVITFHLPLTEETINFANSDFLAQIKQGAQLINTSRGKVLPLKALIGAIENGKVWGACLDVLENEKIADLTSQEREDLQHLIRSGRVLFSPHIAGWTYESLERIATLVLNRIRNT